MSSVSYQYWCSHKQLSHSQTMVECAHALAKMLRLVTAFVLMSPSRQVVDYSGFLQQHACQRCDQQ